MEAALTMDHPVIGFGYSSSSNLPCSTHSLVSQFKLNHHPEVSCLPSDISVVTTTSDTESPTSGSGGSGVSSPEGDGADEIEADSNATLKFISDMLMNEDLDGKKCMFQDCMGVLQAAEKSLSDVLHGIDQPSNQFRESPYGQVLNTGQFEISDAHSYSQPELTFGDVFEQERWRLDEFSAQFPHSEYAAHHVPPAKSSVEMLDQVNINGVVKIRDREETEYGEEGRKSKYSAPSPEESSLPEDDGFLLCDKDGVCDVQQQAASLLKKQTNGRTVSKKSRSKKGEKKHNVVDLREILNQCAQAVASYDVRTANELLGKIRQQSSPFGDGNQRLAHYFANCLEARLVGSSTHLFSWVGLRAPAADILRAYKLYVTSCPFKKMSNMYANRLVDKLSIEARSLHIIDFGILYGFQWPCLIQRLSERPGGPPRLRITGIELPQPGFKPTERLEETGERLAKFCNRFNVQFAYTPIAQKWETIKLEDLKLGNEDMVVVNCLYRLRNLPDETVAVSNPRDTVLNLIRKINPDIFLQAAVNGTYDAPFFLTRFRETLFHFSALYDIFESTMPRENQERHLYEEEVLGRDALNILACEGSQRIDRPETYRRWQSRITRAGFKQRPLDQNLMKLIRSKVKREYHKDFVVDEDKQWMLQGWKGRILHALTCWIPVSQE